MTIRLAMIDDSSRYAQYFGCAITNHLEKTAKGIAFLYLPKTKLFGKMPLLKLRFPNAKDLWTSLLYPFQIWRRALVDKVNVAHIQLEFNTFGHPLNLLLFPLLLVLLCMAKIRIVITVHSVLPRFLIVSNLTTISIGKSRSIKMLVLMLMIFLYRLIGKLSSDLIVHSSIFKSWLVDYGVSMNKVKVIPHGVIATNSSKLDNVRIDYWLGKTDGKRVILCFGVISPRKGLETLIEAYQIVNKDNPDTILVLAGLEPVYFKGYKKKLQALAREMGIENKVLFTGPVAEADIGPLFLIAQLVVLPYVISISASGPLAIALQYAKPIVATDTIFFRNELTNGENCLLSKYNDSLDLASSINAVLKNKSLRETLSRGARALASRNSWKKIAEMTASLYGDLDESNRANTSIHKEKV